MHVLAILDSESWGDRHIVQGLSDMGHQVHRYVYGAAVGEFYGRARRTERDKKNQELVEAARNLKRQGKLDLIFCYAYDDFLLPEYARDLANVGVPLVNLNVDMANQWYRQIRIAKFFDLMLCAQRQHMSSLNTYGARTFYFPMAGRTVSEGDEFVPQAPITFLGAATPYRATVLATLEQAGLPIAIYGRNWTAGTPVRPEYSFGKTLSDILHYAVPRIRHEGLRGVRSAIQSRAATPPSMNVRPIACHGTVPETCLTSLFRRSAINIGFTRMTGLESGGFGNNQVKLRDFEVPLAGGFYLVEEAPDHAELYEIDREIVTWRSPEELVEKVRYYLANPPIREAIAAAGRRRALSDHTWQRRFSGLFQAMGLGERP